MGRGPLGCLTVDFHPRLPPLSVSAEAAEIMRDIGTAIQFLHSRNIAHRDVKVRLQDPCWGTRTKSAIHRPNGPSIHQMEAMFLDWHSRPLPAAHTARLSLSSHGPSVFIVL